MRVFVYWNLHRKCWSVKALEGQHKGRVIIHARSVLLCGVVPKVSAKVRDRVRRTGRKEVHAGLVGTLDAYLGDNMRDPGLVPYSRHDWTGERATQALNCHMRGGHITYNPHRDDTFVYRLTRSPYAGTAWAVLTGDREVTAYDPTLHG